MRLEIQAWKKSRIKYLLDLRTSPLKNLNFAGLALASKDEGFYHTMALLWAGTCPGARHVTTRMIDFG